MILAMPYHYLPLYGGDSRGNSTLRFVAIIFILNAFAQGGVVQTLDGKSYSGDGNSSAGIRSPSRRLAGGGENRLIEILSVQLKEVAPSARRRAVDQARHRLAAGAGISAFSRQNVIIRGGGGSGMRSR
jgi:hypothetical protein